ncbi:MAG TPA: protein kinase [Ktedonobacteraceae bacterium]|nr:protein kinase [Ktedonobacteraceae bacterium]
MVTNNNELLGQALGTCTLRRLIGRGGMGAVYLAQQSRPRRTVAVKVLMPGTFLEQQPRAEFLARFRREADAVASLDHINIMPIYEYGEQADLAYLVMPYVTGGTLRQLLEKRGALPLNEVIPIMEQAGSALDSAHAQGIIHRDLKPGNILLHADGRVLLADFGLAKMIKEAREHESGSNGQTALTSAGTIIGTPEYLSPEQGTGREVDYRTDVYSLGVVLFQMLAGQVPFTGSSPVAIAIKHALEEPPSLTQLNPAISPAVEAVVRKALAKNPDDRYSSTGALAKALQEAADADPDETQRASIPTDDHEENNQAERPAQPHSSAPDQIFNAAPTEANPPMWSSKDSTPEQQQIAALENTETVVQPAPSTFPADQQPTLQPVQLSQQHYQTQWPSGSGQSFPYQPQSPAAPKKRQPIMIMVLGSLLTLVVIVGGLATYLHFSQTPPNTGHSGSTSGATTGPGGSSGKPITSTTPVACSTQPPQPLVPAGSPIYSEAIPDQSCSQQGAKWAITSGLKVTHDKNSTTLDNTGSNTTAGMFLQNTKNGQLFSSGNYVVQVQVVTNSNSTGTFGIFYFASPGASPSAFSWIIDPGASTWTGYHYNAGLTGESPIPHVSGRVRPSLSGNNTTIDVIVHGGDGSDLYAISGSTRQGGTTGLGSAQGTFGLAVGPGAKVTFKNVAVYNP